MRRAGFELWDLGGADRSPMMQYKPQVALEPSSCKAGEGVGERVGQVDSGGKVFLGFFRLPWWGSSEMFF